MRKDHLTREEIEGAVRGSDWRAQGSNRYQVYGEARGRKIRVVFAYESGDEITIITAFFED